MNCQNCGCELLAGNLTLCGPCRTEEALEDDDDWVAQEKNLHGSI